MKVEAIRIYVVKSGRLRPIIAELITDEGISGVGEAALAYGAGGTAAAAMIQELGRRYVVGRDPFQIERLWSEMYDHTFWAKGGGPILFAAMSAIEQALWDIKGKALGVPVYELLGGRVRDDVRVYSNGWYFNCFTADDLARAGERTVREGYDAIKCYPLAYPVSDGTLRHPSHRAVDREFANEAFLKIKALRGAVGPDVEIMLDLAGGLTPDKTIRLCHRLEELDIAFVEEPADPFDLGALEKIAERISIPIAVGERVYTRYGFRPVLESRAADILQPDIGNCGGIMEVKKIAAMAEAYSLRVQPHVCASPLSMMVALHVDACIPNFLIQEAFPYWSEEPGYVEVLEDPPELWIKNGRLPIPKRPGLGVDLVAERMRPFLWGECRA